MVVDDIEKPPAKPDTECIFDVGAPEDILGAIPVDDSSEKEDSESCKASQSHIIVSPARVFNVSLKVRFGGCTLAWCAGLVNAVAFHALSTFVSHTTGTLAKVGMGLGNRQVADPGENVCLLLSFVVGSLACGFLIGKDTIHFGLALYDLVLLGISSLLIVATVLADTAAAKYVATAACGLQNGMATHWGGAVIRTTHVTGLFTDVGLLLGRLLSMLCRKRCGKNFDQFDSTAAADDVSKLSVLLSIAFSYVLGVFVGSHLFNLIGVHAFLIPAAITGSAGAVYMIYRIAVLKQNFFSDAEMEIVDVSEEVLALADLDQNGTVSRQELSTFLKEADIDGDGQVSYDELRRYTSRATTLKTVSFGEFPPTCPEVQQPGEVPLEERDEPHEPHLNRKDIIGAPSTSSLCVPSTDLEAGSRRPSAREAGGRHSVRSGDGVPRRASMSGAQVLQYKSSSSQKVISVDRRSFRADGGLCIRS